MHTLQDLNIVAHHTLQDIIKIIMPDWAPHVISCSSWSAMFTYVSSFLHSPCTFINEAISPRRFSFSLRLWYVFDTLYRQCYYKTSRSRFLSEEELWFVGGAKGGLTVQRVLKKLIKLIESNERLNLAIRFLYTAALKKAYLSFFLWY